MNVVLLLLFLISFWIYPFYIYMKKKNAYVKKAVNIFYVLAFINALINNVFFLLLLLFYKYDSSSLLIRRDWCRSWSDVW